MIRLVCPQCQAKLTAKDELAGQKRKCPQCGTPVTIPEPSEAESAATPSESGLPDSQEGTSVAPVPQEGLPRTRLLDRLNRAHVYLVCDPNRVFATWQNDGQGWMLKTKAGPISAKRNADQIPAHGDFMLVELIMTEADEGRRLTGISVYELPKRWALPALARGDHAIVQKIVGPGRLTRQQKLAVRKQLEEQFMPEMWHESRELFEYLSNADFHSPGTRRPGEAAET